MRVLLMGDGGGPLGVGHVIRSLALAEAAVAAGHDVVVAGHFEGSFLLSQLAAAPVEVVQLAEPLANGDPQPFIDLVGRLRPDVLHVDSYEAPVRLREVVASLVVYTTSRLRVAPATRKSGQRPWKGGHGLDVACTAVAATCGGGRWPVT